MEHTHNHNHEHEHEHEHCCCGCGETPSITLTAEETAFLTRLAHTPFLEVASFSMKSSRSAHIEAVALAPVHLSDEQAAMAEVKKTAVMLKTLYDYGLIDIDYDLPVAGSDYSLYRNSVVYKSLVDTIEEGKSKEGFLFDMPHMDCGSISLTELGRQVL